MRALAQSPKARALWIVGSVVAVLIGTLVVRLGHTPDTPALNSEQPSTHLALTGPPWIYGRVDARFTIVAYLDLECPYCREYFPALHRWIDEHPEVRLQWHHLPLAAHEPKATQAARLAECAGLTGGNAAFWKMVAWIFQHDVTEAAGLTAHIQSTQDPSALQTCVDASRPDAFIRTQAAQAARDGIQATPTLRLSDSKSDRLLTLLGPVQSDALLSAIDLLLASDPTESIAPQ